VTELDEFKQYYALADYRLRFGVAERRDLLELVGATELTDEQTQLLKDGTQLLVGYLGAVRAGWDDDGPSIH